MPHIVVMVTVFWKKKLCEKLCLDMISLTIPKSGTYFEPS